MCNWVIGSGLTMAGIIIGTIITVCVGPWVSERFKLREIYLAPYRKWCYEFYGELDEFNRRYIDKDYENYSDISDIQITMIIE